jgi:hypothetical protein
MNPNSPSPELPSGSGTGNCTSALMSTPVTPSRVATARCAEARTLSGVIVRSNAPLKPSLVIST